MLGRMLAGAQVRTAGIKPTLQAPSDANSLHQLAGAPVLGFALGPGAAELHAIVGTVRAPQLGDLIAAPENTKRLYLPPRQQYVLVERSSEDPAAVWAVHRAFVSGTKQDPIAIKGALAHPDLVAFSPRGNAVALYSEIEGKVQVVGNLPAEPSVSREVSLFLGVPSQMAVSDDASLVVAEMADGTSSFSWNGAAWRLLPGGFTPTAWTFIPNTHDLVISDAGQKVVVALRNIDGGLGSAQVCAPGVQANLLSPTKSGDEVVAVYTGNGTLWTIELKTGAVTPGMRNAKVDSLLSLRDGRTFLLSSRRFCPCYA